MATSDTLKLERLYFKTRNEWREWLSKNYNESKGIWFIFYKKATNIPTLTYDEAVEEALCFGWVDSLGNKLDDQRHILLFTPRKPKSPWSRLNKTRIKKLIKENLMTDAGLSKIEAAKVDGSWSIYDEVEDLVIPEDLIKSLKSKPNAFNNFSNFSDSTKKGLLWWLKSAKRPETRGARIKKLTDSAEDNINPLQFKK